MKVHNRFIKAFGALLIAALLFGAMPTNDVLADYSEVNPALQAGADRLVAVQNDDGGWDWPLDDGDPANASPLNTLGPIGMGLIDAHFYVGGTARKTAFTEAGSLLLTKTNNFSPSDGYLAAQLDKVLSGTTYTDHVIANYYGPLAAGTYDKNGAGTLYDTAGYVNSIRTSRESQGIANLAAWDVAMGLVGAAASGADTTAWIAGVKAEIDELDGEEYYDVIGLAGAVYGLAYVDEDYDPTAGEHASASNLADLAAILASYQIDSGGFAWNSEFVIPNDGNETIQETAYALLALNEFDRITYLSNIIGAADYMLNVQLSTGGWENYPGSGENNEITGEALWGISIAYAFPSTNEDNEVASWAHVNKVSADLNAGTITLEFVQPRSQFSCFEYRTDGDTSQQSSSDNYNILVSDLYPFNCYSSIGSTLETFDVDEYIEVRTAFGADKEERFYWTKFELVGDLWVCEAGDCGHPGYGYNSIQDAIDAADIGATIHVMEGTYNDLGGTVVNKSGLNIILEDGVVIQNSSPCFTIEESFTRIEAASIGGAKCVPTGGSNGIDVDPDLTQVEIIGLEIDGTDQDTGDGINFAGVVTNAQVVDNFIHDMDGDGVYFGAQPVDQTGLSFYIQGNLFKHNTGVGVNDVDTTGVNAEYNSWSEYAGPTGLDWDGSTNADTDPFTHVDLYMVSTNPDVDNWANQVFVDDSDPITPNDTITYQVKAHVVNLTGASFDLNFPTSLVSAAFSNVNSQFSPPIGISDVVTIDSGVISFDGVTGNTPATVTPLTGDIMLFEVTFTGVEPGEAALDFDEDTDEFSMSPDEGPSNNIYADELVGATLDVITRPTLVADGIEGPYVAGTSHQINIETCNADTGGDWSESVAAPIEPDAIAWVRISDVTIAEIASLQFLWQGNWYDFSVQGGPAVQEVGDDVIARFGNYDFGVEVPNNWCDYDAFRVTFAEPGTHEITVELYDMMDTSQNDIGGDDILLTYLGPITIEVLGDFDVTGTISMQGRTVRSGVPLTLTDVNGAPIYGPFTDDSGPELAYNVLFSPVNGGIYEITTLQPRYLNVTADLNKQFLVNSAYVIEPLELQGGNAIWTDNDIDINDASLVGAQYGWTGNTSTQDADVNFDDKVNIQDLALVGGNFDLDSATAYADWLLPEYNGYVEGVLNTSETGAISGSVAGDYNLTITGQLTEDYGTSVPNVAFFDGYVTGDFEGTITGGKVSNMGVDPLYAVIDVPGMTETVRIVGNFVKSGIGGHFKGQIITGDELDPVTSLTITGGDTVNVGDVLDLDVTILPATATDDVRWSIWINPSDPSPGAATIDELTGEVTGIAAGNVTVVVITVDDSGMSWTNKQIAVTSP